MHEELNLYQDRRIETKGHFGVDISSQRADDLDLAAVQFVSDRPTPRALDAASATGGQAIRMAVAGAKAIALDQGDYADHFSSLAMSAGVQHRCEFIQADLQAYSVSLRLGKFDAIVCQRMIHYVPFQAAVTIVSDFARALCGDGCLFISASGLHSELGSNYVGKDVALEHRYAPLSAAMVDKHDIVGDVCLYTEEDMAELLTSAGLRVKKLYSSSFGNIKAEAIK